MEQDINMMTECWSNMKDSVVFYKMVVSVSVPDARN